jgi:WD40 repeat protein
LGISPDGKYAITAQGRDLYIWDLETGEEQARLEGHSQEITGIAFTPDGHYVVSASEDQTLRVWELDWDYEFPASAEWDEGARPVLDAFLDIHTHYVGALPKDHIPTDQEILLAASSQGKATWSEADFQQLLVALGFRGYGWLRPEGVRQKLNELASERGRDG